MSSELLTSLSNIRLIGTNHAFPLWMESDTGTLSGNCDLGLLCFRSLRRLKKDGWLSYSYDSYKHVWGPKVCVSLFNPLFSIGFWQVQLATSSLVPYRLIAHDVRIGPIISYFSTIQGNVQGKGTARNRNWWPANALRQSHLFLCLGDYKRRYGNVLHVRDSIALHSPEANLFRLLKLKEIYNWIYDAVKP